MYTQYYTIAVGKLNAAKMANFMEIDIYVLVACPENSLVESQVVGVVSRASGCGQQSMWVWLSE